jgi:hypothetical protein
MTRHARYVVFHTASDKLTLNDLNGVDDVFVYDRITKTTARVSGSQTNGASTFGAIDALGTTIMFMSAGSNLVKWDTNGVSDVFVSDRRGVAPPERD